MDHVPRIEIHNWNTQPSLNSPIEGFDNVSPLDSLPVQTTLLDQPRDNHNAAPTATTATPTNLEPQGADTQPPKPRHFWSHIRRSKSDHGCYRGENLKPDPQPAMRGGRLVWSPEQHIWLFERRAKRRDTSVTTSTASTGANDDRQHHFAFGHYSSSPRPRPRTQPHDGASSTRPAKLRKENKESTHQRGLEPGLRPRAVSATTPRRQRGNNDANDENDDVELLSAQLLPGHYSLSVYDYVGNGSLQQQQSSESLNTLAMGYPEQAASSPNTPAADHVANVTDTNTSTDPYGAEDEDEEPSGPWMSIASKFAKRHRVAGEG